ncbi:MAG: glycosyltransferase family 39 protein [Candidatus Omnitrophica bacterium]|nr:glycosyltransferase family 39 protein [Candidatus Omnitrophota bacterium]
MQKLTVRFESLKIQRFEAPFLLGIAFIVITVGLIALVAPPNTWDSMTYHMSRVSHWIQNHNVNHYPSHLVRQLKNTPGAEFVIMHFQILTGGDRLANLVQWFSMLGSIIGVSLIAKLLGAGKRGQIFSAVICATIPMGILQGSSTQNDYVVTFWIICFIYYILLILKKGINYRLLIMAGGALGLALLTKVTAYIYALPFLGWLGLLGFKKFHRNAWKAILIIIIIALSINLEYFIRNFNLYNSPFGQYDAVIDGMTLPLFISNVLRNVALHMGTPSTIINQAVYAAIKLIHELLGVSLNDPRITFASFHIPFSFQEDHTGNFIHFALIVLAMIVFLISHRRRKQQDLAYYLIAIIGAFFISCLSIRWNPWQSRYQLPLFVLFCPFIATTLSDIKNPFKKNKILLIIISVIFSCMLLGLVLYNYFAHKLIEAMYKGESVGFLNKIIERQATHSLGYYVELANTQFLWLSGGLFIFLLILFFLYRFKDIVISISLVLLLLSLPWLLHNQSRKLVGEGNIFAVKRSDQYFSNNTYLKDPYIGAVDYIKSKGHSNIGIILCDDDDIDYWEYPFIALLQENSNQPIRIEHVNVENESSIKYKTYPFNDFNPTAIILVSEKQGNKIANKNNLYTKEWSLGCVSVFIKQ